MSGKGQGENWKQSSFGGIKKYKINAAHQNMIESDMLA